VGSNGRSTELSWYYREAEPDPTGVHVGFEDPYAPPNPPPDLNAEAGFPALYAVTGETGKRCSLDGIIVDCGFVAPLIEGGAVVTAPDKNLAPVYNKNTNQFVGYAFFDSNRGGYAFNYQALQLEQRGVRLEGDPWEYEWTWVKKTEVFHVDLIQGELVGGNLGQQSRGGRRGGKQKPIPSPTPKDPKAPCRGKNAADLDYSRIRQYRSGSGFINESARDHILRNHTIPGVTSPRRLYMQAVLGRKSLYGASQSLSQSDLFDNIKAANASTFSFGSFREQRDQVTGNVTQLIFEYQFQPTVVPGGSILKSPPGRVRLNVVGVEYAGGIASPTDWNTLILDPDCVGVQTSFPGRLPQQQ